VAAASAGSPGLGGERIGRFELTKEIGRGVLAVVYQARDPLLDRFVAVKAIDTSLLGEAERAAYEQRFLNEARIAARLSHPGIIVVHDTGTDAQSGRLFIALEYLEGRTLEEVTASAPLPWSEALRIVARVADSLHHAHEQGVVHRDVKPGNIMLLPTGEPKLMDFGIAKVASGSYETSGTARVLGTPLYLSPEQASGEPGDRRTDVFSLGAVAYRLLTGRHAFAAESVADVLDRVRHDEPPPPSSVVPGIPRAVDRIVGHAMAKAPRDRPPDAWTVARTIEELLALPAPAEPAAPPLEEAWLPEDKHTAARRGGVRLGIGLAILAGVVLLHLLRRDADTPAFAPLPSARPVQATPQPLLPESASPPKGAPIPAKPASSAPAGPSVPAPAASSRSAQVSLVFPHTLKSGRLLVFVDGARVLDQPFRGYRTGSLIAKRYRGAVRESIQLQPGRREVRVQVRWDDNAESARVVENWKAGSQRRLRVSLGGLFNKNLTLALR
jgi:serine/threonine-protein kinase